MNIDGEKLLARLEQVIETGMEIASDFGEKGDREGFIIAQAGLDSARRIVALINSGDYTTKDDQS